jgi:hypothetical protein
MYLLKFPEQTHSSALMIFALLGIAILGLFYYVSAKNKRPEKRVYRRRRNAPSNKVEIHINK